MKNAQELNSEALEAARKLRKNQSELTALYQQIAEKEGLEIEVIDEDCVEFRMNFTVNQILSLMERRKGSLPLSRLVPQIIEEYLTAQE